MPEERQGRVRRDRGRKALWSGLLLAAAACSGGEARPPTPLLSRSIAVEGEMRDLVTAWAKSPRARRIVMGPAFEAFRKAHPDEPLSQLADAFLAWIDLEKACADGGGCDRDALRGAAEHARRVRAAAGPGTVADIASTVEGAALRRQGQAAPALDLLRPLENKLIDPWARALYDEEVVAAAVDAGNWRDALRLMRIWLRIAARAPSGTGPDELSIARAAIQRHLGRVPAGELLALLDEGAKGDEEEQELRKLLAGRLVSVARDGKNAALAQHLLSTAGTLLGDKGDEVAQLAAGASKARVEARTVGLALSLGSDRTRRRGADIAEGVAFGLELPGSAARLVSRDDHGSPERLDDALSALSADGASVLIAGSDQAAAGIAAAFAEAHHIPVLLLRPPPQPAGRFSFVVGASDEDVEAALIAGLAAKEAAPVAILTDHPDRPRTARPDVAAVRGCAEAASPWKGLGVGGLVLAADPECARLGIAAAALLRLRLAAGFEVEGLALPPGSLLASAGSIPVLPARHGGETGGSLGRWLKNHASPTWWAALGHDAAVLAWAGVQVLPAEGTEDPAAVEARRAQAAAALASAKAELWTTDAHGFGGSRALPRTLGTREVRCHDGVPCRGPDARP